METSNEKPWMLIRTVAVRLSQVTVCDEAA